MLKVTAPNPMTSSLQSSLSSSSIGSQQMTAPSSPANQLGVQQNKPTEFTI